MNSTVIHEASHATAAIMLGRRCERAQRTLGFTEPGEELGHAYIPIGDTVEATQMGIALVGYWSTGTPGWPPTWEDAMDEEPEDLGLVMLHLGVNEERYAQFVEVTRKLMADPLFIRLRNAIARALTHVPVLERQDLEALAAIHLSEIGSKQWSI